MCGIRRERRKRKINRQRLFILAHVLFVCIFIVNIVNGISKGDDKWHFWTSELETKCIRIKCVLYAHESLLKIEQTERKEAKMVKASWNAQNIVAWTNRNNNNSISKNTESKPREGKRERAKKTARIQNQKKMVQIESKNAKKSVLMCVCYALHNVQHA